MASTAEAIAALTAEISAMNARLDREYQESRKVSAKVNEMAETQRVMQQRLNRVEPIVDTFTNWKAYATGALAIIGIIGGAIWTVISLAKEKLLAFFGGG